MTAKIYRLFTEKQILSVSDLTRNIRFKLEEGFQNIWVEGEISNFKLHTSGHMYFSLKDEFSQIQCVMFRRENGTLNFEPGEGLKVVCSGKISVYAVRGQYQLYVDKIEPKGIGALQLRFEQLKEKLRQEGLFDESFKKEIPYLPRTIGIITSIDGAALHDILHVLDRRFSTAQILIYPVKVQGAGAAESIAEAVEDFNLWKNADVLIVGRGGGSLEDLWAFNEEIVARAIFDSQIPVVSAVGHEVDYTIADFVSDLRAPTPSAAAEMVLPMRGELLERLEELQARSTQGILGLLKEYKQALKVYSESSSLRDPLAVFRIQFQRLDELKKNLVSCLNHEVEIQKERVSALLGKLEALGPLSALRRGFSVTLRLPEGRLVTEAKSLKIGDRIKTKLKNGFLISEIKETGA